MIQSSGKPEGVPRWAKSPGRKPRAFAVFSGLLLLGRAGKQSLQALGKVQLAQLQELADGIRDRGCVCAAVRLQEGLRKPERVEFEVSKAMKILRVVLKDYLAYFIFWFYIN